MAHGLPTAPEGPRFYPTFYEIGKVTHYKQSSFVLAESFEDSVVLYDSENERYYSLNQVGGDVWDALPQNPTEETLVDHMLTLYDVSQETVTEDVRELLIHLEQKSLIQRVEQ